MNCAVLCYITICYVRVEFAQVRGMRLSEEGQKQVWLAGGRHVSSPLNLFCFR